MKKCQRCESDRIVDVTAKCSDLSAGSIHGNEWDGYVPDDLGVGGGDYVDIVYCMECGQLQGKFPLPKSELERAS